MYHQVTLAARNSLSLCTMILLFFLFWGGPNPLANLQLTSEIVEEEKFLRVFHPLSSNI